MNQNKYKDWLDFLRHGIYSEDTPFLKFAILWLSFNAYLNERNSGIERDFDKVENFSNGTSAIIQFEETFDIKKLINEFKATRSDGREFVENVRTKKTAYRKYFNSENNTFLDYMKVIYQIRCNFFHGDKIPLDNDDKKLVQWAYSSFFEYWSKYIENKKN